MSDQDITASACDVCVLIDGDHRMKPDVVWCQRCQAWICRDCRIRPFRRFMAMWKRKLMRVRGEVI